MCSDVWLNYIHVQVGMNVWLLFSECSCIWVDVLIWMYVSISVCKWLSVGHCVWQHVSMFLYVTELMYMYTGQWSLMLMCELDIWVNGNYMCEHICFNEYASMSVCELIHVWVNVSISVSLCGSTSMFMCGNMWVCPHVWVCWKKM